MSNNDDNYSGVIDHSIVCDQNVPIDKSSQNGMYKIYYIYYYIHLSHKNRRHPKIITKTNIPT